MPLVQEVDSMTLGSGGPLIAASSTLFLGGNSTTIIKLTDVSQPVFANTWEEELDESFDSMLC